MGKNNIVMMTTSNSFEGYKITEYKGIVYGEIVVPNGLLGALTSGTFFTIDAMTTARKQALDKLEQFAVNRDANGIVGVDIDICDLNGRGLLVSANGTCVNIEPIEKKTGSKTEKYNVSEYNQTEHIRIASLKRYPLEGNHEALSEIELYLRDTDNIKALCADIIIETIFGEIIMNENVGFSGFNLIPDVNKYRSKPVKIIIGQDGDIIDHVKVDIKKYMVNGKIYEPESHEFIRFEEYITNDTGGVNLDELLLKLETAKNATEVAEICKDSINVDGELDKLLEKAKFTEKLYGSGKNEAIKYVKDYLVSKGVTI